MDVTLNVTSPGKVLISKRPPGVAHPCLALLRCAMADQDLGPHDRVTGLAGADFAANSDGSLQADPTRVTASGWTSTSGMRQDRQRRVYADPELCVTGGDRGDQEEAVGPRDDLRDPLGVTPE